MALARVITASALTKRYGATRAVDDVSLDVVHGEIFLSGGLLEQVVGGEGCENPPPGVGCDPVPITKSVPNPKVWAMKPR